MVDVTGSLQSRTSNRRGRINYVTGPCSHEIEVKVIPFNLAQHGLELCVDSARSLLSAARLLRTKDKMEGFEEIGHVYRFMNLDFHQLTSTDH